MALIVVIPASLGHSWVLHEFVGLRFLLLVGRKRLHEFQTKSFFFVEDSGASVRTCVDDVWLCSCEAWAYDQLRAVHEDVEAEVVPVEADTPGRRSRCCAEETDIVGELVANFCAIDEFTEVPVYAHCADGFLVAFRGEDAG